MITADEIWGITRSTNGKATWTSPTTTDTFYFEKNQLSGTGTSKYAWLFDYTWTCTNYGCNKPLGPSETDGYWTSSYVEDGSFSKAWFVLNLGKLELGYTDFYPGYSIGIRPVITISKEL